MKFVNRKDELHELETFRKKGGLLVLFGRRRVGKTRLLDHWIKTHQGLYSQAIEGLKEIQLQQIYRDIRSFLPTQIEPKTWSDLFEILEMVPDDLIFCIDEFPYLVASDPSLPSILQKWLDHRKKKNIRLILCGSSNRMMHNIFLNSSAPLFGRSWKIIHIKPMAYHHFCKARSINPSKRESFIKFSLVGGIPKYWEFLEKNATEIDFANELYFSFSPFMENEPKRILQDEQVLGINPISVLEAIGRGAERPSEIASRLEVPQTQISKVVYRLMDASILIREIPFGQSEKNPKNVLYKIKDPSIRFWYKVYSPNRTLWEQFSLTEKKTRLLEHASIVFEDYCRNLIENSKRYWEKNIEFDMVRFQKKRKTLIISEIKFKKLTSTEKKKTEEKLKENFLASKLSKKYLTCQFEVLDLSILNNKVTL